MKSSHRTMPFHPTITNCVAVSTIHSPLYTDLTTGPITANAKHWTEWTYVLDRVTWQRHIRTVSHTHRGFPHHYTLKLKSTKGYGLTMKFSKTGTIHTTICASAACHQSHTQLLRLSDQFVAILLDHLTSDPDPEWTTRMVMVNGGAKLPRSLRNLQETAAVVKHMRDFTTARDQDVMVFWDPTRTSRIKWYSTLPLRDGEHHRLMIVLFPSKGSVILNATTAEAFFYGARQFDQWLKQSDLNKQ